MLSFWRKSKGIMPLFRKKSKGIVRYETLCKKQTPPRRMRRRGGVFDYFMLLFSYSLISGFMSYESMASEKPQ